MPGEIEPQELACIVGFAERPRAGGWSLRSALCRYAQPEPGRVSQVLEVVRRIEAALHPHQGRFEREGPEVWSALQDDGGGGVDPLLVEALAAATEIDRLGDTMAEWAVDRHGKQVADEVDATVASVARRLDAAGIAREERRPPPGVRRR